MCFYFKTILIRKYRKRFIEIHHTSSLRMFSCKLYYRELPTSFLNIRSSNVFFNIRKLFKQNIVGRLTNDEPNDIMTPRKMKKVVLANIPKRAIVEFEMLKYTNKQRNQIGLYLISCNKLQTYKLKTQDFTSISYQNYST